MYAAFPVLVPRHYAEQAADFLGVELHVAQGDAPLEAVVASLEAPDPVTAAPTGGGRQILRYTVLALLAAILAFLAMIGMFN